MSLIRSNKIDSDPAELENKDRNDLFNIVFFNRVPRPIYPLHALSSLYRGAKKLPNKVFNEGFKSHGANTNLVMHVEPKGLHSPDSAYIPTTLNAKEFAKNYPYFSAEPPKQSFVYEIKTSRQGLYVWHELEKYKSQFKDMKKFEKYLAEKEVAFKSKIYPHEVKGAWVVDIEYKKVNGEFEYTRNLLDEYIANPNYKSPKFHAKKIWYAAKILGPTMTVVGAGIDGFSLCGEYKISAKTGSYRNTYQESARIAGGWAGAIAAGKYTSISAAKFCTRIKPPVGSLVCGFAGGIGGSLLGYYYGASETVRLVNSIFDLGTKTSVDYSASLNHLNAQVFGTGRIGNIESNTRSQALSTFLNISFNLPLTIVATENMRKNSMFSNRMSEEQVTNNESVIEEEGSTGQDTVYSIESSPHMMTVPYAINAEAPEEVEVKATTSRLEPAQPNVALISVLNQWKEFEKQQMLQQQVMDDKIRLCGTVIRGAANLICEDPKLAKQVTIIADSASKMGTMIAASLGAGLLASTFNPYMAAGMLVECAINLASLMEEPCDPTRESLQQLTEMLSSFYDEFRRSHQEVLQTLDMISREQLQHFIALQRGQQTLEAKIDLFEQRSTSNQETLKSFSRTINTKLDDMTHNQNLRAKKETALKIRETVNTAMLALGNAITDGAAYNQACATIMNYVSTAGAGATHQDLIGSEIQINDYKNLDRALNEGEHPHLHLQTLCSVQNQMEYKKTYIPSEDQVVGKIKAMLQNTSCCLSQLITISALIDSAPRNRGFSITNSLFYILQTCERERMHFIPLHVNGRWSVLIVENGKAIYLALPNNKPLDKQIMHILQASGYLVSDILMLYSQANLTAANSYLLLLETAKKIPIATHLPDCARHIAQTMDFSSPEYKIETSSVTTTQVVYNPDFLNFLALNLLQLTYTLHPELGERQASISSDELQGVQKILNLTDSLYVLQTLFCDTEFFKELIKGYQRALDQFMLLLTADLSNFDQRESKRYHAEEKIAVNNLYTPEKLVSDSITFNLYGNWYKNGYVDMFNSKNSDHNRGGMTRQDGGNVRNKGSEYNVARSSEVNDIKKSMVKDYKSTGETRPYALTTYGNAPFPQVILPPLMTPHAENMPLLPASSFVFSQLPEQLKQCIKEAQARNIGHLFYSYDIVANKLVINVNFKMTSGEDCLLEKLSVIYNKHAFYIGKEAVWYLWCGGRYAVSLGCDTSPDALVLLEKSPENYCHNTFHTYASGPVLAVHEGIMHKIAKQPALLTRFSSSQLENNTIQQNQQTLANKLIAEKQRLKQQYCLELRDKLNTGNLGDALSQINMYFQLLKLFSYFLFPESFMDTQSAIYKFFNRVDRVKDRESAFGYLQSSSLFVGDALFKREDVAGFQTAICRIISEIRGLKRLSEIDLIQSHLINCLYDMAPGVTQSRVITEQAAFFKEMTAAGDKVLYALIEKYKNDPTKLAVVNDLMAVREQSNILIQSFNTSYSGTPLLQSSASLSLPVPAPHATASNPVRLFSGSSRQQANATVLQEEKIDERTGMPAPLPMQHAGRPQT